MTSKYYITNQEYDNILSELIIENSAMLLTIPGVYEVLSEHFNNEILDRWETKYGDNGS